jgi:hypothetical protein
VEISCVLIQSAVTEMLKSAQDMQMKISFTAEYAGIGIFLLMRTTQVLLMRGNRVCTLPSIYLDQHGEEDYELRRNQKLYKSELRLNEVQCTVYLASLLQVA